VAPSSPSQIRSFVGRSGLARSIDLMRPVRERAARTGCVAQLVSGTYVPRTGRVGGSRYGSGMAHLLGCDLQR